MDDAKAYGMIEELKDMSPSSKMLILQEIVKDEEVNSIGLVVSLISELNQFKKDAKEDIYKLATAGLELGEREMRRVTKMKGNTRKKTDAFYLGMVRTLLSVGTFQGTAYEDNVKESADFSDINESWYEQHWKLKTIKEERFRDDAN